MDKFSEYNSVKNEHEYADTAEIQKLISAQNEIKNVLDQCMEYLFESADPEYSLNRMLGLLGAGFDCDRVYIFEFDDKSRVHNTYEWCAENVKAYKDILYNISVSDIEYWMDEFRNGKTVDIEDLEDIRNEHPSTYSILKPEGIKNIIIAAIHDDKNIIGFIGVDNFGKEKHGVISTVLNVLGYYIASQLRRRNMLRILNERDRRDPLTGAFNRNTMFEHVAYDSGHKSLGVICCNIAMERQIEDEQIVEYYRLLKKVLDTKRIYHIGRKEFAAVFPNISREKLVKDAKLLRVEMMLRERPLELGYAWTDDQPAAMDTLVCRAEEMLESRRAEAMAENIAGDELITKPVINRYLEQNPTNLRFFLDAITRNNNSSYFYFGDMQENIFYISDNMRDEFGFESNVVSDLLDQWAGKITNERSLQMFRRSISQMIDEKRGNHDLRYQVTDGEGKNVWVQSYGELLWNRDKTKPLLFAGRVSKQDESFTVDAKTNLPCENVLIEHLKKIKRQGRHVYVIAFSLNSISKINKLWGRSFGDRLIRSIADELVDSLADKLTFYRLTGMRGAAIIKSECREDPAELINQIRGIIEKCYKRADVIVKIPCSCALMKFPEKGLEPIDFIENMVSMLRAAQKAWEMDYLDTLDVDVKKINEFSNMTLDLIRDVLNGMDNFRVVVQPVVCAKTGRIFCGETLLRWRHNGKDVSPGIFISILEDENMIQTVGRWVFEEAVRACSRILSFVDDFYLTVNVSLQQLSDEDFAAFIADTLSKYELDGKHIVIEMTESCMDQQPDKLGDFVSSCRHCGIRIALDDFGSGYSSLRVLMQYPSSIIKLDRSLLLEMTKSEEKQNFISSIVYACHRFGKKVCMEGVETEKQDVLVKRAECDMIQGFFYHRPLELEDAIRLMSSRPAMA